MGAPQPSTFLKEITCTLKTFLFRCGYYVYFWKIRGRGRRSDFFFGFFLNYVHTCLKQISIICSPTPSLIVDLHQATCCRHVGPKPPVLGLRQQLQTCCQHCCWLKCKSTINVFWVGCCNEVTEVAAFCAIAELPLRIEAPVHKEDDE